MHRKRKEIAAGKATVVNCPPPVYKINLKKLSNADLIELCKACDLDYNYVRHRESIPYSSRIIVCASKTQITDLQAHDTIITPDGVWQINEDFEETSILTKKEMTNAVGSHLLPNLNTTLTILASNDELPNDTDDEMTTQAKQITAALNLAFIKKPNSLYIGQSESKHLQRTISALKKLKQDLLVPEILFRKLHHLILKINHLKSDIQLIQLSQKISNNFRSLIDKGRKKPGASDEELDYILKTFPQHTQFKNLSENDLKILSYIASIYPFTYSSRIIVARSIDAINASDFELQEHDTIILPDKIVQIGKEGRANTILTKKEMPAYPTELIPQDNALVQEITDANTIRTLNQNLNQALQNQPNALYITNPDSREPEENTFIAMLSAINQLAENELASRETSNNLFLQALSFKTDAEFLNYYWQRMHIAPNSKEPTAFEAHIQKVLEARTELSNLPDAQLKKLILQCRIWTPKISHRILCSRVLPADCEIGDTVILPTGVYQIRLNSHGQVTQELVIDEKTMNRLHINDFLPDTKTEVALYDDYSKPQAKELIGLLNPHIAGHLKGMYLCENPRASEGYGMVNIVLQKMAEQVLRARRLEQYRNSNTPKSFFNFGLGFGIFGSSKKVVPTAKPTQTETIVPTRTKPSIRDLRKTAKKVKKFQKSLQEPRIAERVVPNPSTILVHTERSQDEEKAPISSPSLVSNIIDTLDLAFHQSHSQTVDPKDDSVKIKLHEEVVMEFDKDSVAIYKPIIKTTTMRDREKAELFLKALGIPPTTGKHGIEVKGGHRPLRKAIRELFKEFKQINHLQKKKSQLKRQRSDSDTDTDLSSDTHHSKFRS